MIYLSKLVKEMVDDVGVEDSNPKAVSHFLHLSLHLHIKRQDDSKPATTSKT
jgi:hypothetical protein